MPHVFASPFLCLCESTTFFLCHCESASGGRGNLSVLCEIPASTRRLLHYVRNDTVSLCTYEHAEIATSSFLKEGLLAMTWCPFVPTSTRRLRSLLRAQERSLTHYVPRNDSVKRVSLRVLPLTGAHQKCHSRLTCPRPNRGAGIHPPKADKGTRGQRKRVLLRKDSL